MDVEDVSVGQVGVDRPEVDLYDEALLSGVRGSTPSLEELDDLSLLGPPSPFKD